MKIIEEKYKWSGNLAWRKITKYIILHHSAGNGDVQSVHQTHLNNGWSGIGYHFYVRKDGSIYRGRPINTIGAHCKGYNSVSIGVCFEGNFETEIMPELQLQAGCELIEYLKGIYPAAEIKPHCNFQETVCPGEYFPYDKIVNGPDDAVKELTTVNDIVWELSNKGIISNKQLWLKKLEDDKNAYWLARKTANYIRKAEK